MHHTVEAGYRSGDREGCLRGTRGDILQQLERWLDDKQGKRVFWLNGLAGSGKSTIAQTFAETTFADGKLGASFFCSRDFEDRSNIQAVFPTLALQLAYRYPLFREHLLRVLRANPGIGRQSLCTQLENLIIGPFKATHISTLIIIDALDECEDAEPVSAILSTLSRYVDEIPEVRFFITSRPEHRIRSGFRLKLLRPVTEVLKLHEVKPEVVDSDIKLFFRTRLTSLANNRSDCNLVDGGWPSSSDVEVLCEKAAGSFTNASTIVKSVASEYELPTERLALILSLPRSTTGEGKSVVDQLYIKPLDSRPLSQNTASSAWPIPNSTMTADGNGHSKQEYRSCYPSECVKSNGTESVCPLSPRRPRLFEVEHGTLTMVQIDTPVQVPHRVRTLG
jgi:hypothetical protein